MKYRWRLQFFLTVLAIGLGLTVTAVADIDLPQFEAVGGEPAGMSIIRDAFTIAWTNPVAHNVGYSYVAFPSSTKPGMTIAGVTFVATEIRPNEAPSFSEDGVAYYNVATNNSGGVTNLILDGGLQAVLAPPVPHLESLGLAQVAMTSLTLTSVSTTKTDVLAQYSFTVIAYVQAPPASGTAVLTLFQNQFQVSMRLKGVVARELTDIGNPLGSPTLSPIDIVHTVKAGSEQITSNVPETNIRTWIYGVDSTFDMGGWDLDGDAYPDASVRRDAWNRAFVNVDEYLHDAVTFDTPLGYASINIPANNAVTIAPYFVNQWYLVKKIDDLPAALAGDLGDLTIPGTFSLTFAAAPSPSVPTASTAPAVRLGNVHTAGGIPSVYLPVTIDPPTVGPVTLRFDTIPISATVGIDYTFPKPELTLPANTSHAEVQFKIHNAPHFNGEKEFDVTATVESGLATVVGPNGRVLIDEGTAARAHPPIFVQQPFSQRVPTGSTVTFSAVVSGATKYQWFRDGQPVAAATSETLKLKKVTSQDDGAVFFLEAANANGTSASQPVTLNVGVATPATLPGANWQPVTSNTTADLQAVVWSGNQFIAVGAGGAVITSPDGSTWTARNSGSTANLVGAVAPTTNEIYAVGSGGTVLFSPDGVHWTPRNSGTTADISGISFDEAAAFPYVLVGANGMIRTSSDGITWTGRTSGVTQNLAWEGSLFGMMIAVGDQGTILTSATGTTWISRTSNTTQNLSAVLSVSPTLTLASGVGGTLLTSADGGGTWVAQETNTTAWIGGLDYATNSVGFVAVADSAVLITSPDAITWTLRQTHTGNWLSGIAHMGNGSPVFVAVGGQGTVLVSSATTSP